MLTLNHIITHEGQKRNLMIFDCIKNAAELTHTLRHSIKKTSEAISAINSNDKETKWTTLQKYLNEYASFINNTVKITGIQVFPVTKEYYDNLSLDDLNQQLQITIGIVYFKEALYSTAKEAFKQCLEKLLSKHNIFLKELLSLL